MFPFLFSSKIVIIGQSSLYVSPATLTKTAGESFTASVGFNASGSKVCAVEGTLVFNGLTCQSITVASDVMAQSTPTCANPSFLIGIPNCTTSDKALLTLSVRAGNAGTATISMTGVDIIGEGASLGSASTSGSYTINAVVIPPPVPTQQVVKPTQQVTEEVVIPVEEAKENVSTETEQATELTESVGTAALSPAASKYFWPLLIILVVAIVGYGIYWFFIRKKEKK